MGQGQLDRTLQGLAGFRSDPDARRDILERGSQSLLHRPALGGQLVARFCAAAENDPALEDMDDLLHAALEATRMSRESRNKRGALDATHRMLLARLWTRSGLTAPAALELTENSITTEPPPDRADADAMLDNLLEGLVRQADGDALGVQTALAETFPAMPAPKREHVNEYLS